SKSPFNSRWVSAYRSRESGPSRWRMNARASRHPPEGATGAASLGSPPAANRAASAFSLLFLFLTVSRFVKVFSRTPLAGSRFEEHHNLTGGPTAQAEGAARAVPAAIWQRQRRRFWSKDV